ncbi:MAG TPA: hypothetical protein VIC54_02345 [Terriglobales bacterium]
MRYEKKFNAGRKYIFAAVFPATCRSDQGFRNKLALLGLNSSTQQAQKSHPKAPAPGAAAPEKGRPKA